MSTATQRQRAYLAWAIICIVWGTTYLAIKVALETIPPFLMGGLRYVGAGTVLAIFVVASGRGMPRRVGWWQGFVGGALLLGFGNGGVIWAEKWVPTGLTAVMVAATPFWMVGVEAALGGERLTRRAVIGLAMGFTGIVWLVWPDVEQSLTSAVGTGGGFLVGVVALQIAAAGWALGSSYSRRRQPTGDSLGAAAAQMICGGALMLAAGTLTGEWTALSFTSRTFVALLYLLVFGSLVGFVCYIYALHHLPTTFVALYTYVNPIVAVTLGAVVLGEKVGWRVPAAIATVLAGMATVSWRPPPTARRGHTAPKPSPRSSDSSSADETDEKQHHRNHEQQMDERSEGVPAHHPE